jgi:hypothetical protein
MDERDNETEELKRQLRLERLLHESELAKAEHRAYVQKNNDSWKLALVSIFLFCAVAFILGL